MVRRTKKKRTKETRKKYRRLRDWWENDHLKISSHALERARQYCPESMKDLPQQILGNLLAGAIYNPRGEPIIVEPRHGIVYQVALPFYNERQPGSEPVGYALIAPDKDNPKTIVCRTFLDRNSFQLYGGTGLPKPIWYLRFKDKS